MSNRRRGSLQTRRRSVNFLPHEVLDVDSLVGLHHLPEKIPSHASIGAKEPVGVSDVARTVYILISRACGIKIQPGFESYVVVILEIGGKKIVEASKSQRNGTFVWNKIAPVTFYQLPSTLKISILCDGATIGVSEVQLTIGSWVNGQIQDSELRIGPDCILQISVGFALSQIEYFLANKLREEVDVKEDDCVPEGIMTRRRSLSPKRTSSVIFSLRSASTSPTQRSSSPLSRSPTDSTEFSTLTPSNACKTKLCSTLEDESPDSTVWRADEKEKMDLESDLWMVGKSFEIMAGRLSFAAHRSNSESLVELQHDPNLYFVTSELHKRCGSLSWLEAKPIRFDFGPVNLGLVVRFCDFLSKKMHSSRLAGKTLVYTTQEDEAHRTNAAFLICCFLMIEHNMSPAEAWAPFSRIRGCPFSYFRDASELPPTRPLTILDFLIGLDRGIKQGWFTHAEFDTADFEALVSRGKGNVSVVCSKFVACNMPSDQYLSAFQLSRMQDTPASTEHLVKIFAQKEVTGVVRLTRDIRYHQDAFTEAGIHFYELPCDDAEIPSDEIISRFMNIVDDEQGRVAVHCRDGLGMTGTLIALWIMRTYSWPVVQIVAWLRLVRPGMVIGAQYDFLRDCEGRGFVGNNLRGIRMERRTISPPTRTPSVSPPRSPTHRHSPIVRATQHASSETDNQFSAVKDERGRARRVSERAPLDLWQMLHGRAGTRQRGETTGDETTEDETIKDETTVWKDAMLDSAYGLGRVRGGLVQRQKVLGVDQYLNGELFGKREAEMPANIVYNSDCHARGAPENRVSSSSFEASMPLVRTKGQRGMLIQKTKSVDAGENTSTNTDSVLKQLGSRDGPHLSRRGSLAVSFARGRVSALPPTAIRRCSSVE